MRAFVSQILPRRGRGTSQRLVEGYSPQAVTPGTYPSTTAARRSPSPSGGGLGWVVAVVATVLALGGWGMSAHMAGHMLAVAVAAPLLVLSRRGGLKQIGSLGDGTPSPAFGWSPSPAGGGFGLPFAYMVVELVTVWGWHLPAARELADGNVVAALVEQAMFLGVGIGLWRASLAAPAAGIAALLLTSMHMTLLGALIGLAPRPLYPMMAMHAPEALGPLADQQLGGVVMLAIGGAAYMAGGLWLLAGMLKERAPA
ncbi:cytochrome c oxidase assembly protein [Sphingomonas jinjuensis]|uniref:cytochrome c oxidase assembly protein n=1 Tax=Sphingomonas jinjuensis TaxID=535907 RepID=UPI0031B5A4BA